MKSTGSTRQPDHRSTFTGATTMAEVAPGPESVPAPGAEPEVGPAPGPGASTSRHTVRSTAYQLNDGTDYDAEDRKQRDEESRLAESDVCTHVHTTIEVVETCECGMELRRVRVSQ